METEQDVMVKKNNNMKRRRCRRRQRQQLERMVLELTEMRQDIQQLRATEESHNGSIKTLFLSLGDTDFVAEKLQVKTASTTSLASIWLRWQAYDEYYEDDYEEADDFRSDDQRYEDAESERMIHELFLAAKKTNWTKSGKTKPDNFTNPFEVYD
ncbi:unnamed protein product [Rotaria socialis]|nr:unnamed protein product [Rotaria socialis]CAF3482958.1 unnamed protein product [Rotaria socialis]